MYDKMYYKGANSNYIFWYRNMKHKIFWKRRLATVKKEAGSGKLLDVGCAFGFFIKFLEKDFDVYGMDISNYAVEQSFKLLAKPERIKCNDIYNGIPFQEKFDIITAFDIMEHLHSPLPAFKTLNNALKPGGTLYIEIPLSKTMVDFDKEHHYRKLEEWTSYFKDSGFTISRIECFYTVGLRAIMIPSKKNFNYCSIIAKKN